jgi:hypothetical protein
MLREALPREIFVELCSQNETTEEEVLAGPPEKTRFTTEDDEDGYKHDKSVDTWSL